MKMRLCTLPYLWIAPLALLAACSTTPETKLAPAPVRFGMTKADLQRQFGSPLRLEKQRDGSESWYYKFGVREVETTPIYEAETSDYEQSVTVGTSFSTTTTIQEAPVRVSRSGKVFGAIPKGRVVLPD